MAKSKNRSYSGTGSDKPAAKLLPISISTEQSAARITEAEQVPIFEIDGKVYSMSAASRAEVGLTYLELATNEGPDKAASYLLNETLGKGAYADLRAVKGLSDEQFEGVLLRIQALVLPKGRKASKSRKG